jgi:glycosyltransferase involved in cell wall biosynthesis
MKICFFNCAKAWGGGEKWHFDHAKSLAEEGHEVVVVSHKKSELFKRAAAQHIRLQACATSNTSFLNPFVFFPLYCFFKREAFDAIIINLSEDLKLAAPAARLAKIPRRIYRRGSDIPIKNSFVNRLIFKQCLTGVIANSEATKQSICRNTRRLFPAEKIKVIYNGINTHIPEREKTARAVPVVGCLGRLVYQKGIDLLIEIAAILKRRHVACTIRVGGEGALKEALLRQVAAGKLQEYVTFTGFVNHPAAFMQDIDVLALPSRWEGFGYVLAEAMLAQTPLVAFDVSSNPELVHNGRNGFLVPFGDTERFADALQALVEQPATRLQFGQEGRRMVEEQFDFEKNKQQVIDYLTAARP